MGRSLQVVSWVLGAIGLLLKPQESCSCWMLRFCHRWSSKYQTDLECGQNTQHYVAAFQKDVFKKTKENTLWAEAEKSVWLGLINRAASDKKRQHIASDWVIIPFRKEKERLEFNSIWCSLLWHIVHISVTWCSSTCSAELWSSGGPEPLSL